MLEQPRICYTVQPNGEVHGMSISNPQNYKFTSDKPVYQTNPRFSMKSIYESTNSLINEEKTK